MQGKLKYFLITLAVIVGGIAIWYFKNILLYLLIATVLTLIGQPFLRFFRKIKIKKFQIPQALAAVLTMLLLAVLFLSVVAIFIPLVIDEARIISSVDTHGVIQSMETPIARLENFINQYQAQPFSLHDYLQSKLSSLLNFGQVSDVANSIVGITGNIFIAFFAVSFFTFFFLKDGKIIFETLLLLVPPKHEKNFKEIVDNSKRLLIKYFIGICLDVLCVILLISSGLYLFGVKNAIIIGCFAGVMNVIPYIGPLIGGMFGIVIGISASMVPGLYADMLPLAGKIAIIFVVVNLIDSLFLQPFIFSNSVKAHPLEIFLVIMIAASLAGIGGMIVAVPTYTVLRVIAKQFLSRFKIVRKLTEDLEE